MKDKNNTEIKDGDNVKVIYQGTSAIGTVSKVAENGKLVFDCKDLQLACYVDILSEFVEEFEVVQG